jgi:hypothetical protein
MARLNIEDPFWLEVVRLIGQVGDEDKAIGNAIRFFRFAQEKHKYGELVSELDFKRMGFLECLIPIFAERVDGGIRAVGAEKHFGWLVEKIAQAKDAGQKSAEARRTSSSSGALRFLIFL